MKFFAPMCRKSSPQVINLDHVIHIEAVLSESSEGDFNSADLHFFTTAKLKIIASYFEDEKGAFDDDLIALEKLTQSKIEPRLVKSSQPKGAKRVVYNN